MNLQEQIFEFITTLDDMESERDLELEERTYTLYSTSNKYSKPLNALEVYGEDGWELARVRNGKDLKTVKKILSVIRTDYRKFLRVVRGEADRLTQEIGDCTWKIDTKKGK